MSRIAVLTKEQIVEGAFSIARKEGHKSLTVRSIAKHLGTSTAPIYTQFGNIGEIFQELESYVLNLFLKYTGETRSPDPFLNLGLGIIAFVLEHQRIFTFYFLSQKKALFNFKTNEELFIEQMNRNPFLSILGNDRLKSLLDDMWTYTYGLATMICTGLETEKEFQYYRDKIEQTGTRLIQYHLYSSGKLEEYLRVVQEQIYKYKGTKESNTCDC